MTIQPTHPIPDYVQPELVTVLVDGMLTADRILHQIGKRPFSWFGLNREAVNHWDLWKESFDQHVQKLAEVLQLNELTVAEAGISTYGARHVTVEQVARDLYHYTAYEAKKVQQ